MIMTEIIRHGETWLTRAQAAELLQCSVSTVSRIAGEMRAEGSKGVMKTGRNFLRINQLYLEEYICRRGIS